MTSDGDTERPADEDGPGGAGRGEARNGSSQRAHVEGDRTRAEGGGHGSGGILSAPVRRTLREGEIPHTTIRCAHAAECAGCPLIEHDYTQQLAMKRSRVVTATSHYPTLELVYTSPTIPADPIVSYRGRAKLVVSPEGKIGLFDRGGHHEVVDIPECRVLSPALAEVANAMRALLAAPPDGTRPLLLPYDPGGGGVLRALDLREVRRPSADRPPPRGEGSSPPSAPRYGEPAVLVTFVLQRDRAPSRNELREAGRALRPFLPRTVGIAASLHDADSPQILGSETLPLDGVLHIEDAIGPIWHFARFGSFVQAHREQAARVHTTVQREVGALELGGPVADPSSAPSGRRARVLDLYSGSGAIGLSLAHAGHAVTMIESFAPAASSAKLAADTQGLTGIDVHTGDVAELLSSFANGRHRFDAVVLNPPRRGASPGAREGLARLAAPLVVYVSCDPDTLARDLDHLGRLGYQTSELQPLDMIPLTEEVETIAVLGRAPPPTPRVVYEDDELVVVDKGPHEPLEPTEGYAVSLLGRCARLPGVSSLYPAHSLDAGTSGICVLGRTPEAARAWNEAIATEGRLVYLAAAKGVTPAKGAITRDLREAGRTYPARTRYRRLAVARGHSILRVIPEGMRPHQVRRHLAAIGHPVLGDERYGHVPTNRYFEEKHGLDRSFLHLVRIEVPHPRTGRRLLVESTLPGDLRSSIERAASTSVLRFLEQKHALGDHRNSSIPPGPSGSRPPGPDESDPPSASLFPLTSSSVPPADPDGQRLTAPDLDDAPRSERVEILSEDD
jgi:23S rRNA (uracil1939-C5)-methyltransferase